MEEDPSEYTYAPELHINLLNLSKEIQRHEIRIISMDWTREINTNKIELWKSRNVDKALIDRKNELVQLKRPHEFFWRSSQILHLKSF